jgi:hypothetical protein
MGHLLPGNGRVSGAWRKATDGTLIAHHSRPLRR